MSARRRPSVPSSRDLEPFVDDELVELEGALLAAMAECGIGDPVEFSRLSRRHRLVRQRIGVLRYLRRPRPLSERLYLAWYVFVNIFLGVRGPSERAVASYNKARLRHGRLDAYSYPWNIGRFGPRHLARRDFRLKGGSPP